MTESYIKPTNKTTMRVNNQTVETDLDETTVTTVTARNKFARAHAGEITLPPITHVGWGDGGHIVENGVAQFPNDDETSVPGEYIVKDIDSITSDSTVCRITVSLQAEELEEMRYASSCGLYDADGDLIAVKNFAAKGMDTGSFVEIKWDEHF